MNGSSNDRRELARGVYEQHNAIVRHLENQRLWFALVFMFLFGGALAFIPGDIFPDAEWFSLGFVAIVSLFGLLFIMDIQRTLKAHRDAADLILTRYDLAHYLPAYRRGGQPRLLGVSQLVPIFFLFCFCISIYLLLYAVNVASWIGMVISVVILVIGVVGVFSAKFDELPSPEDDEE